MGLEALAIENEDDWTHVEKAVDARLRDGPDHGRRNHPWDESELAGVPVLDEHGKLLVPTGRYGAISSGAGGVRQIDTRASSSLEVQAVD